MSSSSRRRRTSPRSLRTTRAGRTRWTDCVRRSASRSTALRCTRRSLRFARQKWNVFMNWRALEVVGVDQRTPVTLHLRDAKLSTVLRLLLHDAAAGRAPLGFGLEDGVVTISTGEDLARNT